jgi:hypothetical protein
MIHLEALNPIFQQLSFESTHSTASYERSAQVRLARAGVLPDCCPIAARAPAGLRLLAV